MKKQFFLIFLLIIYAIFLLSGCTSNTKISCNYNELENSIKITLDTVDDTYNKNDGYTNYSLFIYIPDYPESNPEIIIGNAKSWMRGESIYVGIDDHDDWAFSKTNDFYKPINEISGWIKIDFHNKSSIVKSFNK